MTEVYIGKSGRTAHGKRNGMFRNTDSVRLSAEVMRYLDVEPTEFIWGCTQQYGSQGYNVARQASLAAGFNNNIPSVTVNRLCGSAMSAVHSAYANIKAGLGETYVVGGVEHMTNNPMTEHYYDQPGSINQHMAKGSALMGLTAEMVGNINSITREDADYFALRSHQLADRYMEGDINVFCTGHASSGELIKATRDEGIRPDTDLQQLGELKPSFDPRNGRVTAGNASGIADGASGLVLSSSTDGARARIRSVAVSAGDPATMGFQPVYSIKEALQRAELEIGDVGAWEINEAFGAQSLAVVRALGIDDCKVNRMGGSIAIGHPLGSSGSRILHTLLNSLTLVDAEVGVASLCVGMGQSLTTVIERV